MIAVYYNTNSTPYTMYTLDVVDDTITSFMQAVRENAYPLPSAEVLLLEGFGVTGSVIVVGTLNKDDIR